MDDKVEEVMTLSEDGDGGDCDNGTASPAPATVPKKRGRPVNSEKPKRIPTGRGRGRPAKGADGGGNKVPTKAVISGDGSEEDGTASDVGSPLPNGEKAATVPSKRGRHPIRNRKLPYTIEATGKGRGRPKKVEVVEDDDEAADDDDAASVDNKPIKKAAVKATKKGRGRPKKGQNSDDESADDTPDDEVVRRPVGRPPSGGINLNIARTGRGLGRPKKGVATKRAAAAAENGGGKVAKKPGRPSTSGKGAYSPTGKPRGRPKLPVEDKEAEDGEDDEEAENSKNVADNSGDDGDEADKANSEESEDGL